MNKKLLGKYLENRCNSEELEEIKQWIEKEALSQEGKQLVYGDWKTFEVEEDEAPSEKFNLLLDKIHHKININRPANIVSGKRTKVKTITTWFVKAAAILLIPVSLALLYTLNQKTEQSDQHVDMVVDSLQIVAPKGSRTNVKLSDGTEVYLNSGSKVTYPRVFNSHTRDLKLTGEGYFIVAHNPKKPFIVEAKGINVKAVGTKFNVQAYPEDNRVETTLIEGKVVLDKSAPNGREEAIGSMVPGQHVDYDTQTGKVKSEIGNIEKYIAWKDGRLMFDNANIQEVATKLGRMFNVDISLTDDVKDYTYTVTFVDEPLSQILNLLTEATPISYQIFPRKRLPDGTFSRQKIVLKKK